MTGGITDGEEDRLVFFFGFLKRFLAPGIPVYRIPGVLQEVRTFFVDQVIIGSMVFFAGLNHSVLLY
jgi:hypothetical protein